MLVSFDGIPVGSFQIHEHHVENQNNVLLNPNIEDFPESPKILGNALADVWLYLAQKHEQHQLNTDECQTIIQNIDLAIAKIEEMDEDNKKLNHQFFLARIACFSEEERNYFIQFFKDTIKFDLENFFSLEKKYCFFYVFMKLLFNSLNSVNQDNDEKKLKKNLKVKEIWENIEDAIKNIDFQFSEKEFIDSIRDAPRPLQIENFKDFIACKLMDNEFSENNINLKDEALNYTNLTGNVPLLDLGLAKEENSSLFFLHWLGKDRLQKIQKLHMERGKSPGHISFEDLDFICPNHSELNVSIDYVDGCIEKIASLKKLKKLNFSTSDRVDFGLVRNDITKLTQITDLSMPRYMSYALANHIGSPHPFFVLPPNIKHFYVNGEEVPIPSWPLRMAEQIAKTIANEVIKVIYPFYIWPYPPREVRIKQIAVLSLGILLVGLGTFYKGLLLGNSKVSGDEPL